MLSPIRPSFRSGMSAPSSRFRGPPHGAEANPSFMLLRVREACHRFGFTPNTKIFLDDNMMLITRFLILLPSMPGELGTEPRCRPRRALCLTGVSVGPHLGDEVLQFFVVAGLGGHAHGSVGGSEAGIAVALDHLQEQTVDIAG